MDHTARCSSPLILCFILVDFLEHDHTEKPDEEGGWDDHEQAGCIVDGDDSLPAYQVPDKGQGLELTVGTQRDEYM